MSEAITITFEVSVLGLVVSGLALVVLGMVVYYYRRMARQVATILERLQVPAQQINPVFQHKLMEELMGLPPRAPRRVAITRRLRAAGVKI